MNHAITNLSSCPPNRHHIEKTARQNRVDRSGTILMETVLAIPLFLVLMGGTMWIGDLILAKQKLVIADRYAAWNAGNRHRLDKGGIQQEIQDHFFPNDKVGDQNIQAIDCEAGPLDRWSTFVGATVQLKVKMPIWAESWLGSGVAWDLAENPVPSIEKEILFTGRDQEVVNKVAHHVVLMRTVYGMKAQRTWSPEKLADLSQPWNVDVYKEVWPKIGDLAPTDLAALQDTPMPPDEPLGLPEHFRHDSAHGGKYEDWSY